MPRSNKFRKKKGATTTVAAPYGRRKPYVPKSTASSRAKQQNKLNKNSMKNARRRPLAGQKTKIKRDRIPSANGKYKSSASPDLENENIEEYLDFVDDDGNEDLFEEYEKKMRDEQGEGQKNELKNKIEEESFDDYDQINFDNDFEELENDYLNDEEEIPEEINEGMDTSKAEFMSTGERILSAQLQ